MLKFCVALVRDHLRFFWVSRNTEAATVVSGSYLLVFLEQSLIQQLRLNVAQARLKIMMILLLFQPPKC